MKTVDTGCSLSVVGPLDGAGIVTDEAGPFNTGFLTHYNVMLEEDPSGSESADCTELTRKLGFYLHRQARVTFTFDGKPLVNDALLDPGEHTFEQSFGLGKKTWSLIATLTTEADTPVVETRSGTVEVSIRRKSSLRVGATSVKGVNLTSGGLTVGSTDLQIPGLNGGLRFVRTYGSAGGQQFNPLGIGWNHNYQSRLVRSACQNLKVIGGDGSGMVFERVGERQYVSRQPGVHARLIANGDEGYTLITKAGIRYVYDEPIPIDFAGPTSALRFRHNLRIIEDPFGNRTFLFYNEDGTLAEVRGPSGRALRFGYLLANRSYPQLAHVETVGITPAIRIDYEHDQHGRLIAVTRGARTERYTYSDPCLDPRTCNHFRKQRAVSCQSGRTLSFLLLPCTRIQGSDWSFRSWMVNPRSSETRRPVAIARWIIV